MSTEFHSNNPFRRKASTNTPPAEGQVPLSNDAFPQPPSVQSAPVPSNTEYARVQAKAVKKFRVQSPPHSSPEGNSIARKPPTPIPRDDESSNVESDPFEVTTTDSSEDSDDETETVRSNHMPPNPFQKTLATLAHRDEKSFSDGSGLSLANAKGAGRASLDVEAFKRLLMTGNSGVPALQSTPPAPVGTGHGVLHDGGSSTDVSSSASRQSIFEPIQEIHPESPRTSHEVSDPDDERQRFAREGVAIFDRRKPPPPSSRHGKLIRVELKDDDSPVPALTSGAEPRPPTSLKMPPSILNSPSSIQRARSPTDLNKPLPAAPARASHEMERESVFDKEAAGKTPEPPSPSSSLSRKLPPAPRLSRRHSQLAADSRSAKATIVRLSSNIEEELGVSDASTSVAQTNLSKGPPPPPPPPSRRPASIRNSSHAESFSTATSHEADRSEYRSGSAPAPPPTRVPSIRHAGRPSSVLSMDMTSKRASTAPPPPPPPRQRASSRASAETPIFSSISSGRTSSDYYRRSIDSSRGDSLVSLPADQPADDSGAKNILADLSALQREVDALRGQYETRGTH